MKRGLTLLLCLVLLSGCLGGLDIRERALIQLMGIDYGDDVFKVTLQIFNPSGQNEDSTSADRQQVISAEGVTLSEALYNASLRVGRTTFLGDARAIIVGEAAASGQMDYILHFLGDSDEVYPQLVILIAAGEAKDIVNPETEENQVVVSNSLEHITSSAVAKQTVCPSSLLSISKGYYAEGAGAAVLRVRRREEGDLVLFESDGIALFSDRGLTGRLGDAQHRGMLYLRGLGEGTILDVNDPVYGRIALEIRRINTHVKTELREGSPAFDIRTGVRLLMREASAGPAEGYTDSDLARIAGLASRAMTADMLDSIRAAGEAGSDVFGFYRHLRRSEPAYWQANEKNWHRLMATATYEVRVDIQVDRLGD